jgi:diguanylate cyclase (GGDEF)-like protein
MKKRTYNLFAGVLLFIVLDLSILGINYWIAHKISKDAIAINLSGRQRMLSQRITKSLLALPHTKSDAERAQTIEEFRDATKMFDQTLSAFAQGGEVVGGDGKPTTLNKVTNRLSASFISETQQIWEPTRNKVAPYFANNIAIPESVLAESQSEMLSKNLQILKLMNKLTFALENESRNQANFLRIVQTIVFFIALTNFIVVVRKFHLLAKEAHEAKNKFSMMAFKDALTGLFNRRHIEDELASKLMHGFSNHPFTLMMLDLDGFKPINDQFGHDAGDTVLQTIASRLSQLIHRSDTVARLGGDEFVLICHELANEEATTQFSNQIINAINEPITLNIAQEPYQVNVGASIGIVFQPSRNKSKSDILRMADHAMYQAKKAGKNQAAFFHED